MTAVNTYREAVLELIRCGAEESAHLERASELLARSLQDGGVLHVFGSGHSMLPAIDATSRAGGLAPVTLVHDPALAPWEPTRVSRIERLTGYGTAIAELQDLRAGEVIVVISHSGINPVPTQLAQQARERGLTVVAITSREHSLTGPTSTILAGLLLHSLAIGAMEQMSRAGVRPPVLQSMRRAGGDDYNETVLARAEE